MTRFNGTRRGLLKAAALLPLASVFGARAQTASSAVPVAESTLAILPGNRGKVVSESLASLSYETGQLADPTFFSPRNRSLIALFRQLNPKGILRIGGNTSDYTVWSEYRGTLPEQKTRKGGPQQPVVLHPESLRELAGFLRETGWSLVFGVNLKIGVPDMAVALGRAVRDAVGDRLLAIQIGNEANNYEKDYDAFDAAWSPNARALQIAGLPLAGPDTGANTDWVAQYIQRHGKGQAFASRHYYRDAAPRGSIGDVLGSDPGMIEHMEVLASLAEAQGLPLRLTEANSYYFGGRDGVSNVFASALWGADFMLAMAQCGVVGIHFHGGTLASVEASLGRDAKSDLSADDIVARRDAVSSRYSAIAGDVALGFQPRPLFHGLVFAQQFAGARLMDARLETAGANVTAYVADRGDQRLVALVNKDMATDVAITVSGMAGYGRGQTRRLHAPSLDSRTGVVFDATTGREGDIAVDASGQARVHVPRSSAALVRFEQHI
ncbi:glycosyl hydrolase family 79 C-terminal domain-containing protein [Dyella terrae]|nr:glycosyl hydrolase family 79 C-terminal domain-containing protein [Dyella terrae]TBR39828.1 hypothetical protein EYV96_06495 [Dyella terrae]